MVLDTSFQQQENSHLLATLSIKKFCCLHAEQLTYQDLINCVRVVYHDSYLQKHQEIVEYKQNIDYYSSPYLTYLKSKSWTDDFPQIFEVNEFTSEELLNHYVYTCVMGYKNYQPEYIQIVTHKPIDQKLKNCIQNSARILSEYIKLHSENLSQKSKIQLLEHTIHKASHQLRNYLSSINLYAYNLYLRLSDNNYCKRQAEIIYESVQKLDSNLTEILSCGQAEKLNIVSQDLKDIMSESIENFQPIIEKKHLQIHLPQTSTRLLLDKIQIQQVFNNLISNAIHFSSNFGEIAINWQIFREEVLIEICDRGPGIPVEDIKKIFNPFYSHRDGGTGLGLTIAKKIVLDHRGNIWAQNSPQGGAIFSIILPRK